ncbi:MAG: YkgJ family cysteine cluster protein [Bryobacteraceae bacterium]
MNLVQIETRDRELQAAIASASVESERRSGNWLVCRVGCTPCCHGPFEITPLDEWRLRRGLAEADPARARVLRGRAAEFLSQLENSEDEDEIPCPALDPVAGSCDLYDYRPVVCRVFGPAVVREDGSIATCELCYESATEEQIAACAVEMDPQGLEAQLLEQFPEAPAEPKFVAHVLAGR